MKKKFFKVITILTLAIFISSCETDNSVLNGIEEESQAIPVEATTEVESSKRGGAKTCNWRVSIYEGAFWINFQTQKEYPYVNTVIVADAPCNGVWVANGGFKIIDNTQNKKRVRVKRINKTAGSIIFVTSSSISTRKYDAFIDPPNPNTKCPTTKNTEIIKSNRIGSRIMYAKNRNRDYTYKWTIVRNGRTRYVTGSSARLSFGSSVVTLTASMSGCASKTGAPKEYFVDANPNL